MQNTAIKRGLSFDDKRFLSIEQYCWAYDQGRTAAYAALKTGLLRSQKRGRRRLIPREAAEEYHRSLPTAGPISNTAVEPATADCSAPPPDWPRGAPSDNRPQG